MKTLIIQEIKKLMYSSEVTDNVAFHINDLIYKYDSDRAKNECEKLNAGKEWEYRLKKVCDYRASQR